MRDADLPPLVSPSDARVILRYLYNGAVPQYESSPEPNWEVENAAIRLDDPDYCFARTINGQSQGKSPRAAFRLNTEAFLVPFAEGVKGLEITAQEYLDKNRQVMRRGYADTWYVVVNVSRQNFRYGQTLLPPMGFIAAGPEFLAQHYYGNVDSPTPTLVIRRSEKEFFAFRP